MRHTYTYAHTHSRTYVHTVFLALHDIYVGLIWLIGDDAIQAGVSTVTRSHPLRFILLRYCGFYLSHLNVFVSL